MSITDPEAQPAQPDEGQGGEASGGSPWESYLTRFPEEQREEASSAFREMEVNANKRFEELAAHRKQWEPFEQTGINELSPEEVSWLVQFRGALDDPNVMQQWWDGYAQENGLTPAQQAAQEPQLDEFGSFGDPQQLQQLIDQATGPLKQKLEQMQGQFEQQQQQHEQAQTLANLEGQVAQIEQKLGAPLSEKQKVVLARFASQYSDVNNAILRGWDDMQAYTNDVQKGAFQSKVDAPEPAERGGVPDVSPEKLTGLDDPRLAETARQFMRNNR